MDQRHCGERNRRLLDPGLIVSAISRNILSAALLVVAVIGIVVQIGQIRRGFIDGQTRLVLAAYVLIALYAAASIYVRLRGARKR